MLDERMRISFETYKEKWRISFETNEDNWTEKKIIHSIFLTEWIMMHI